LWFYKYETEKTEPKKKRAKPEKNRAKLKKKKTEPNRKNQPNRFEPVFVPK
jgi:hypothetical protein